ncbi:high affinity choline transporter 1-like [Babylonia areolata]|uniref:high affinity choline transporter 1-like n=1 Tax=Babylonia areolata TaxID=304850 RepID=UPI003FD0638D
MVVWVMRGAQVVIAAMACALAISVSSIYYLFLLCSDFVYVMLYPQLLCAMYVPWTNTYGSLVGYFLGLIFRLLGGEPGMGLQPVIEYPWLDPISGQQFPFRTLSMLITLCSMLMVSLLARYFLPRSWDFFRCFPEVEEGRQLSTTTAAANGADLRSGAAGVDNAAFFNGVERIGSDVGPQQSSRM